MLRNSNGVTTLGFILGITVMCAISVVTWPIYSAIQNRDRDQQTESNMNSVQCAIEDYRRDHAGRLPTFPSDLALYVSDRAKDPWTQQPITIWFDHGQSYKTFRHGLILVHRLYQSRPEDAAYVIHGTGHDGKLLPEMLSSDQ